jgi:hypothetical protein
MVAFGFELECVRPPTPIIANADAASRIASSLKPKHLSAINLRHGTRITQSMMKTTEVQFLVDCSCGGIICLSSWSSCCGFMREKLFSAPQFLFRPIMMASKMMTQPLFHAPTVRGQKVK